MMIRWMTKTKSSPLKIALFVSWALRWDSRSLTYLALCEQHWIERNLFANILCFNQLAKTHQSWCRCSHRKCVKWQQHRSLRLLTAVTCSILNVSETGCSTTTDAPFVSKSSRKPSPRKKLSMWWHYHLAQNSKWFAKWLIRQISWEIVSAPTKYSMMVTRTKIKIVTQLALTQTSRNLLLEATIHLTSIGAPLKSKTSPVLIIISWKMNWS